MFPVFSRGRALDLCAIAVGLMTLACFGGGAPAPVISPAPLARALPDSSKTLDTAPTPTASAHPGG